MKNTRKYFTLFLFSSLSLNFFSPFYRNYITWNLPQSYHIFQILFLLSKRHHHRKQIKRKTQKNLKILLRFFFHFFFLNFFNFCFFVYLYFYIFQVTFCLSFLNTMTMKIQHRWRFWCLSFENPQQTECSWTLKLEGSFAHARITFGEKFWHSRRETRACVWLMGKVYNGIFSGKTTGNVERKWNYMAD